MGITIFMNPNTESITPVTSVTQGITHRIITAIVMSPNSRCCFIELSQHQIASSVRFVCVWNGFSPFPTCFLPAPYQRPTNSLSNPPLFRSYRTDNERRCTSFGGKQRTRKHFTFLCTLPNSLDCPIYILLLFETHNVSSLWAMPAMI